MNSKHLYLWAFILSLAGIFFFDLKKCHNLPFPGRIVRTGITFGLLDLFSIFNEELAGVVAIGMVIATYVTQGFGADCQNILTNMTTQPQTATFLAGSYEGTQPPSYAMFASGTPSNSPTSSSPASPGAAPAPLPQNPYATSQWTGSSIQGQGGIGA